MATIAPFTASDAPPRAAAAAHAPSMLARRVPTSTLFGMLTGALLIDLLLLCRFLGLASPALCAGWALLAATAFWLIALPRCGTASAGPTVATLLACIGIATIVMLLGGEGRFFYANVDWQVRDAVLRDMAVNPWPFVYDSGDLLRAPLGMYLIPALAGKLWGQQGADLALLFQNASLLGLLLAIGSTLFKDMRARLIALATFLGFSGLDILGQLLAGHAAGLTPTAHLEGWGATQYSSTITLAFWVPQHAIAGWFGALAYLLWRAGRLHPGQLLMLPPLIALWSPLAAMGLMPFLAHATLQALRTRQLRPADLALPGIATLIALPALFYLSAAGDAVGARLFPLRLDDYLLFEIIEVLPYLLIAAAGWRSRFGGATLAIAGVILLAAPFIQVGWSIDFAMRATIPALAILSLQLADMLADNWPASRRRKAMLLALLAFGGITGLAEIIRALSFPTSPPPHCQVSQAWDQSFAEFPKSSYFAPLRLVPSKIRPHDPIIVPNKFRTCYDRIWPKPALLAS